jgi:lipopolysaccharide transport system ATP-binding protein
MGNNIAIEFEHVSKQYRLGLVSTKTLSHDIRRFWITNVLGKEDPYLKIGETNDRASKGNSEYVWALRDIDFKVEQGDVVGIIGKNGAGKSTLLKLLSRVTGPTTGTIRAHGRIGSLLEVGTGFHGEMTGRENIFMNGAILGMSRAEIQSKLDEIIDFSGCERYIDTPVKRYSSGMTVRLGFAVAAFLEPEILVVDEVLAVGDAEFQKKAIGKMKDVSQGQGRTVLFVSHNMGSIRQLCTRGVLLKNGMIDFMGDVNETVSRYLVANIGEVDTEIIERLDKIGNKKVEITNIAFKQANGEYITEAFMGEPLEIEFKYRVNDPIADLSKMIVAVSFCDAYGNDLVEWVSDEMHHDFGKLNKKEGSFFLKIPNLYLRSQMYYMSYQISLNTTGPEDFCDKLTNATSLLVMSKGFFTEDIQVARRGYQALMPAKFAV